MRALLCVLGVVLIVGPYPSVSIAQSAPSPDTASDSVSVSTNDISTTKPKKKKRKKKRKKRKKKSPIFEWEHEAGLQYEMGSFSGLGTRQDSALAEQVSARYRAQLEHRNWRLQTPLRISDRRTAFASLTQTTGSAGIRLRHKSNRRLAVTLRGDLAGRWRNDWPDQYQPLDDGTLGPTDRYSRWSRSAGIDIASVLWKKHHFKAQAEYKLVDAVEDPNFEPFDAPTHLVPQDHEKASGALEWLRWFKKTKTGGGIELGRKESFFAFSRDALTGRTHARPGGQGPNPFQVFWYAEPYVVWEYGRLKDTWQLDLFYGYDIVSDRYQGYYSSRAHHPRVEFAMKAFDRGKLKLDAQVYWRRYGPNSYAETATRPALEYGDRRTNRTFSGSASYEHGLGKEWTLMADAGVRIRRTNYPDYTPMVFPRTRTYDIDFDYTNFAMNIGVAWTPPL